MRRGRGLALLRARGAVIVALAVAGAAAALTLTPSTALDTFVSSSSPDYAATHATYRQFGADPVIVLVRAPLAELLAPANIATLSRLEACLGGQRLGLDRRLAAYLPVAANGAAPYGGRSSPCGELMRLRAAAVVYGPGGFLNHAVAAVNTEIASLTANAAATIRAAQDAARALARARGLDVAQTNAAVQAAGTLALERELAAAEGATSAGRAKNLNRAVLAGVPSIADPAFLRQVVFGTQGNGATPSARFAYLFPTSGAALIQVRLRAGLSSAAQRKAIAWIRQAVGMRAFHIAGASYAVTGEPVLLSDLSDEIGGQLGLLLGVAVAVMAVVLLAVFRRRLRLLPLAVALAAVAITFGLTALFGGSLTLADVAVFPVLLGLGVDYGVQLRAGTARGVAASAALATAAGFLALLISPVPMVAGFGLLLVVGVAVAFAANAATTVRPAAALPPPHLVPQPLLASVYGAGEILGGVLPVLLRHPRRVIAVAAAVALVGWALAGQAAVQSDLTRLVPANMPALDRLHALERLTGSSGAVDVLVSGGDLTAQPAVRWMRSYEQRIGARFGGRNCERATLCPALSLPSLLQTAGGSLTAVPGYFQRAVLSADHRYALLAFGIRLMPLSRQRQVIEQMRAALRTMRPPHGLSARLAGAAVLAADAEGSLSSTAQRLLMLAIGLVLVAVALLAALRRPRRVLAPLIPIVLATGWSALLVYLLRIPLNPLSATLGTLVIAITTEFSVLLSEGARSRREAGMTWRQAIDHTYRSTGVAVLTSAVTAIAGFAVLIVSTVPMLRDFGLLAVVDLAVSLAGVMLVLPATLALIEVGGAATPPRRVPGAPGGRRPVGIR